MADVSKIKLPSGTTYNIKDTISGYTTNTGTITKVQTTAGAHTTINVSSGAATFNVPTKTSHLTNDSGFITNAGVTGVKGNAESSYRTGQVNLTAANIGAVGKSDELLTTNSFAPDSLRGPYISKIDNAFYAADKRWTVTTTGTGSVSTLFDGSYESNFVIAANSTITITIDCTETTTFPGYPYGNILVSFYHTYLPSSVSGRVYCTYEPHGIGWHDIVFSPVTDSTDSRCVYRGYNGKYAISKFEITITAPSNTNTYVNQIEMHLDRPSSTRTPFLSKYGPETLYYDLTAPNFIGNLTGNVQATTINGVTVGSSPKFTDTDEKVSQSYKTASEYTYWRPLLIGYSSGSAATFTPSSVTNLAYTFNTLKVQPSTGTIRINNLALYKGSYTATFTPTTLTADRTITVPDKAGTMALTSDITSAIADLPEPMIFKGSVGTSGTVTWANLAAAAATNEGWTYKVITAHTAETGKPAAQVGDTIISNGTEWVVIPSGDEPSGTVTSVAAANATNGGLTISGSPITSSGTITIGHSNVLTSAQTTQAVYPIKIDKNGHISAYGSAVTIPTVPSTTGSATTGVSIADHSSTSIYGVSSSTTSVTGVSGSTSVYGVKSGTNSTTTASKASGANGTAPTLGTAISIYGVKSGTNSTTTASHVKSGGNGTAPTLGTAISLIGVQSSTTTASKVTVGSHSTDYGVKSAGSGSFTQGTFDGGSGSASLTFTMDTTDTKKLVISFSHTHTPATHGADSHTHTAPTLGSKVPTVSASDVTVPIKNASATSIPNVTSAGSASTWVFEDVTVPIRADSATSIPNVTSVGSASTWSFTDVTVPIRADSATTVPTAAASATTVPIKNGTATTVITSKTHSVTDNGHTHTI